MRRVCTNCEGESFTSVPNPVGGPDILVCQGCGAVDQYNESAEPPADEPRITLTQAADLFPLAYSTLAEGARRGRFWAQRVGGGPDRAGMWLTTKSAVQTAIDAGKLNPRK